MRVKEYIKEIREKFVIQVEKKADMIESQSDEIFKNYLLEHPEKSCLHVFGITLLDMCYTEDDFELDSSVSYEFADMNKFNAARTNLVSVFDADETDIAYGQYSPSDLAPLTHALLKRGYEVYYNKVDHVLVIFFVEK